MTELLESKTLDRITSIIEQARDMTIATIRPDGFPQATTVSFASDGLALYFVCDPGSQKARNIAACDKVSLTIDLPYADWKEIRSLSMGATAERITAPAEMERIGKRMLEKFPEATEFLPQSPDALAFFRVNPKVISVLDYSIELGHTDEVVVES